MSATSPEVAVHSRHSIAPLWHTIGLVALLLAISIAGAELHAGVQPTRTSGNAKLYLLVIVVEWLLVAYVKLGLRPHIRVSDLLGRKWDTIGRICWDIALAIGLVLIWIAVAPLVIRLLGPEHWGSFLDLLPHGKAEMSLWIVMALSAGFCEELIFRGYLQRQISDLADSAVAAVLLQALLFGLAHGYQGIKNMTLISVLGVLYGILVFFRKSLIPGMLAHAASDIISVL